MVLLVALYVALVVAAVIMVVRENRNPIRALSWVIALIFLPFVGLIFYLFFGRSLKGMHMISRKHRRKLLHNQNVKRVDLNALPLSSDARNLVKLAHNVCRAPFMVDNRIEIFTDGATKFATLKRDIENASESVYLQYYIIQDDRIGMEIADLLIKKAKEGVDVRVIYDNVGSFSTKNKYFKRLMEGGVDIHPFFKVTFPQLANRVNWRNHRKVVVIDSQIAYMGGMNIADRYVMPVDGKPEWRDTHFRLEGRIVESCLYSLAIDWNFKKKVPQLTPKIQKTIPFHNNVGMQFITSGPVDNWDNIALCFLKLISAAKRFIGDFHWHHIFHSGVDIGG